MAGTIVITGASSGIGKATALLFAERGWKVVATMRDTARSPFKDLPGIYVVPLDATSRSPRLHWLVGSDARFVLFLRSVLPLRLFRSLFTRIMIG